MNKDDKTRKRTIAGLISRIYQRQKNSSKTRNHIPPSYSNKELLQFALNSDVFISLYDEWVGSEFDRKMTPSFDRLDDSKGYSFENFNEWMTFHENNQKAHADMRSGKLLNSGWFHGGAKPVSCVDLGAGDFFDFISISQASRETGVGTATISDCCSGNRRSAGGYVWWYSKD